MSLQPCYTYWDPLCTALRGSLKRGMLYVTILKSYISYFGKFSRYIWIHMYPVLLPIPISNPHPLPCAPELIGAAERTLTGRGSRTHPNWLGQPNATLTVRAAGRGLVGAGGELGLRPRGSRCALAACAACLRRALMAALHTLRRQIWIHTLKSTNSYTRWPMNSFIHMNSYTLWPMNSYIRQNVWIHMYPILVLVYRQNGHSQKRWGGVWSDHFNATAIWSQVQIPKPGNNFF